MTTYLTTNQTETQNPPIVSAAFAETTTALRWMTAVLVALVPILFDVGFSVLSVRFDYPQILRLDEGEVLTRFHQHQDQLLPAWYVMFIAAALFIPAGASVSQRFLVGGWKAIGISLGTVAGLVQAAGLARWVFLVPELANRYTSANNDTERYAIRTVFTAFHQWSGMALGEHLGYLFTGLWTLLIAMGVWKRARILSLAGMFTSIPILLGMLEPLGISWVGAVNAIGYMIWSLWMVTLAFYIVRSRN